jgi:formylglycine-generating enzyme required for sulfatase activity
MYSGKHGDRGLGAFRGKTTAVNKFPANDFGLFCMHGNVSERYKDSWCQNYKEAQVDENNHRILRGGSWDIVPRYCRSACRHKRAANSTYPDIGFRVVCEMPKA